VDDDLARGKKPGSMADRSCSGTEGDIYATGREALRHHRGRQPTFHPTLPSTYIPLPRMLAALAERGQGRFRRGRKRGLGPGRPPDQPVARVGGMTHQQSISLACRCGLHGLNPMAVSFDE
jgi:hypothetical protein